MRKNNVALMVGPALLTIADADQSLPQTGPASLNFHASLELADT